MHQTLANLFRLIVCALLFGAANLCHATEGGGTSYPLGAENYMSGAMPPPGFYGQLFVNHYEADNLRGNDGRKLPVDFRVRANAIVPRLIWVSDYQLLGGSFALHAIVPLVDVKVDLNGLSQHNRGLGDVIFGPALGFHHSDKFHSILAFDMIAPTGRYDKNDLANPGRNYWVFEPVYAMSYVDPNGPNLDAKVMYDFNRKNPDTDYRSGQEFHVDYALGWGFGNGLVAGVGGYFYRQTTNDRQDGERIEDNKGRSFAIGPSLKYSGAGGWFVTAKWSKETEVRNRAQGDAYWLKLTVPF
ncbi:SphA family protein [Pseudomonas citronellolis]|uniref:SphA family protein n=1 Tax=Pseudomonas citronellolis TaxID=53408 RepID=UPI0023E44FA5|nr:transporter [Pseudomonas citronellolis]MDF3933898.1 transporter [Pseudomonas citronellolis]